MVTDLPIHAREGGMTHSIIHGNSKGHGDKELDANTTIHGEPTSSRSLILKVQSMHGTTSSKANSSSVSSNFLYQCCHFHSRIHGRDAVERQLTIYALNTIHGYERQPGF
jgi:hypothetical protein